MINWAMCDNYTMFLSICPSIPGCLISSRLHPSACLMIEPTAPSLIQLVLAEQSTMMLLSKPHSRRIPEGLNQKRDGSKNSTLLVLTSATVPGMGREVDPARSG
jgi:hypothetical protein